MLHHSCSSLVLALVLASSCVTPGAAQQRAGVLDFLYPAGMPFSPPTDVHLDLPLRVGVAFAPGCVTAMGDSEFYLGQTYSPEFTGTEQQLLLERVVHAFRETPGVASIEVIPSSYLKPGGGFENVDQLRSLFGLDLLAILSYDQSQFQDYNLASLTYWSLLGAYVVEGNENETHTFVDVAVFDIVSRSLLFNAAGRDRRHEDSSALEFGAALREDSTDGFRAAVDGALVQLQLALDAFREQAKTGTVHGPGTPKLVVTGEGAGALGALDLCLALVLLAGLGLRRRTPIVRARSTSR